MKHSIMRSAILGGLLSIFSSPIKAQDVSEEEQPSARVASIVTCNQGQSAQLADISACLGALKNSVGFPGPGQPNLNSKTEIIESLVEIISEELGSGGDSVHIKIDILDSKIDLLQEELSIVDASLCSKLVRIEDEIENSGSVIEDIDSKIELLCSKVELVESQNDVIESKIDDINTDVSISDAMLCTKLLRIESKVDSVDSEVEVIDSNLDVVCTKVLRVESKIDDLNVDLSLSDAELCTKLLRIESKVDSIDSEVEVIDSNLDVVCTKVLRVESKVDVNISITDLVQSEVEIIDSNLDIACTKLNRIESKVDVNISITDLVQSEVEIIDSNVDIACTKLNRIESKVDVIDNELSLTDDSLCSKLIVIDSKVDVIDSITDDLHDTACIGRFIIRNSDLPFTIDASINRGPGLYSIGEPLTWNADGAAITITTDGVDIDFHCLSLDVVGSISSVATRIGIDIRPDVGQCSIRNGRMNSLTVRPGGNATTPTILINKVGGANNDSTILIDNMLFISDAQVSTPLHQLISASVLLDLSLQNCRFFQGTGAVFLANCSRTTINNCLFELVFDDAILCSLCNETSISNSTFKTCGRDIALAVCTDTAINSCIHQFGGRQSNQSVVQASASPNIIVKDCCNMSAGRRAALVNVHAYEFNSCGNVVMLRNAINLPTTDGILLNNCANCKLVDNSIDGAGLNSVNDTASVNLVVGNCSINSGGVAFANLLVNLPVAIGALNIANANNRWFNIAL